MINAARFLFLSSLTTLLLSRPLKAEGLEFRGEMGTVGVLNHTIKFGKDGTRFDYKNEGAQDVLFPIYRLAVDWKTKSDALLRFLYQPLAFETKALLERDITLNDEVFSRGEAVDLLYSFPFYRMSYMQQYTASDWHYGLGAGLQIRNARIVFTSADGSKRRVNQNVGPVPLLSFMMERRLKDLSLAGEISTMYAPIKYLNGSDSDVVGAFTDLSVQVKKEMEANSQFLLTLRYLGGGASGTSSNDKGPGDGYSSNWIDLLSFTVGVNRTY